MIIWRNTFSDGISCVNHRAK